MTDDDLRIRITRRVLLFSRYKTLFYHKVEVNFSFRLKPSGPKDRHGPKLSNYFRTLIFSNLKEVKNKANCRWMTA